FLFLTILLLKSKVKKFKMDKRKEEIIEAAIRRFSHYGFAKTTMNEIAEDLKITKANLYYYYPDKTALIKDVICSISHELISAEEKMIAAYDGDFLGTLFAILKFRAEHMRKHYMLYINENLDWLKGLELSEVIKQVYTKDLDLMKLLVQKAVEDGSLKLDNIEESCAIFGDIIRGLTLTYTIEDILCKIPNLENVDKILASQINAAKLIFQERIVTNK